MITAIFKGLWDKSLTKAIYKKIKAIPVISLFFDFDFASRLWQNGFFGEKIQKIAEKTGIYQKDGVIKVQEKHLPCLMLFCLFVLIFRELLSVPLTFITASLAVPHIKNKNFPLILLFSLVIGAALGIFVPFSVFLYIIYVETGIILFFLIKYLSDGGREIFLRGISVLWIISVVSGRRESTTAIAVAFLPYALLSVPKGKIKWYFYPFILLLAPALVRFISGFFGRNIVETGVFLWRYGFGGSTINYDTVNMAGENLKIISYVLSPAVFLFFWYVLRVSRSAVVKLFKRDTKNKKILLMGLFSLVGFSIYTFLEYNGYSAINIILYLVCAGLLKRSADENGAQENK